MYIGYLQVNFYLHSFSISLRKCELKSVGQFNPHPHAIEGPATPMSERLNTVSIFIYYILFSAAELDEMQVPISLLSG